MDPPDRTELLRLTVNYLQHVDLVRVRESLQKTHQYFQDLTPMYGFHFETKSDNAWCVASHLLENARDISMREHQPLEMQLKAERPGRISPLPTLLSRESFLSELSDSHESEDLVEPTSSSSEVSISSSLPQSSSPLTLRFQTEGKLRESKENLDKSIQTDVWLGHSMDDEVDGAVKNASCGSSAIQNCHPCYSSTGSAEPLFQGESGLSDNLPRITDQVERHGGAAASTSWCNDVTDENRRNRERKVDSKSLKISQESKDKSKEHLSVKSHNTTPGKFLGLKDDSSITTPIDDIENTAENANGGSFNTFSRHQESSFFTTEQGYQATYSFQAPSFHSKSSKVSAKAQGPNSYGPFDPNPVVWDLPVPARPLLSLPCNGSEHLHTLSCDDTRIVVIPPHALIDGDSLLAQTPLLPQQKKVKDQRTDPEVQREKNSDFKVMNGNPACLSNTSSIAQGLISPEMEISALPQAAMNRNLTWETRTDADQDTANQGPLGVLNETSPLSNDDSLADLERRVAETCSLVEKNLKRKEEKEKAMKEKERRRKEERVRKEQQARERREREASETRQAERRNDREEVSNPISGGGGTPTQTSADVEGPQWLCEHYICRVKFPCCGKFFPCHRCHNNSGCSNDNSKAREACYVECSVCGHQQEINQDAQTCARCKTKFSAYLCSMCKHFTGTDKNPYHCTKCGICRIFKYRSFHCDVCNVCLDKRLECRHSCRENSGHDECCICLEDAFSGCQILPCSHKVHRECAIAMIQNGVRSCPICRHPLYSQTNGNE